MQQSVSMRASTAAILIAIALMFMASAARADLLISDFDGSTVHYGGVDGWFGYGSIGVGTVSNPTGGTGTWMYQEPGQYYGQMTNQSWATPGVTVADFNNYSHLEFDLIVPGSGPNVWLPNASTPIQIEFQTTGGTSGTLNHSTTASFDSSVKDTVIHMDVDYSSLLPFDSTATGWNLSFETHPGYDWAWDTNNASGIPYAAYLLYDNANLTHAVPEPGALSLLGLASLAALRRRAH